MFHETCSKTRLTFKFDTKKWEILFQLATNLDVWLGVVGNPVQYHILLAQGVEQAVALTQLQAGQQV